MEFQFKKQQYQTDAVTNTVEVFAGQPYNDKYDYLMKHSDSSRGNLIEYLGYRNAPLNIGPSISDRLLCNIREIQKRSRLYLSDELYKNDSVGACALDIEMETGTGKTYVYIKTIFELNKRYGWKKFIIVVPSIAIREGVMKSFSMLEHHFFVEYEKKANYFIYDSSNLSTLKHFAASDDIEVMIINTQAFNKSLDASKNGKANLVIYSERDEFNSYRPIDVIANTHPILIIDEPQKSSGEKTQAGLRQFNPLFTLNYSATHKVKHNCIYALDAVDAFNQKLVKRISVKGFEIKNLAASNCYLYLDRIELSKREAPVAYVELEIKTASGAVKRKCKKLRANDDLFIASNGLNQYQNLRISEICPMDNSVKLSNGKSIYKGDVVGDQSEDVLQRLQIRETIASHFDKEEELFERGIKTLSLFFIDEVDNYRHYNDDGSEEPGKFAKWFEEEYHAQLLQRLETIEKSYANAEPNALNQQTYYQYLLKGKDNISSLHNGYFAKDKKGRIVNDKKKGDAISEDISAYDLILRNKERLLSFEEPTRFIFSHSTLREGWDNPNVFQICTLRHTNSAISKRQEVGRGLRLSVNCDGVRMDESVLGDSVHQLNTLTVIANENYESFVTSLQSEIEPALHERPTVVNGELFSGKTVILQDGSTEEIDADIAKRMQFYFEDNGYIDKHGIVTDAYKQAIKEGTLAKVSDKLAPFAAFMHEQAQATYAQEKALSAMVINENAHAKRDNGLNENFSKAEFKKLWESINKKYFYTVSYDSNELINNAINALSEKLRVDEMAVKVSTANQHKAFEFKAGTTRREFNLNVQSSGVKYDLVGDIAKGANITRRSAVAILKGMPKDKFALFAKNPEQFIARASQLIKDQKASMIVEHISYEPLSDTYSSNIFTEVKHTEGESRIESAKHITDYLFLDSKVEKKFAKELEQAEEVCVYAKLPRGFSIPTPVGNYSPDWAITFKTGQVKHMYFIAETKGNTSSSELRPIEQAKITAAKRLYNTDKSKVHYEDVGSYDDLLSKARQTK